MKKRMAVALSGLVLTAACSGPMDWDVRSAGLNTGAAATGADASRPQPDARGVISYPTYQVAVARPGDTLATLAQRVGVDVGQLASYNALAPDTTLRRGEVVALPRSAAASPMGAPVATGIQTGAIDVTTLASNAISTAPAPAAPAPATASPEGSPAQHRVQRGETAYSIARTYNVSPKALAEWNGLDASLSLREGQVLTIPNAAAAPASAPAAAPASAPAAQQTQAPAAAAPAPAASSGSRFAMPAQGSILRPYQSGKNEGLDIGAAAGSPVVAAADGTVAAITRDTDQVPILVLRHANNLLTVYAGIDNVAVAKGASVSRGQKVATVRAGNPAFLHFEVRDGFNSVDPAPYLP